jgi:tetratricopeptide (TPR) repeat protein
VDLTIIIPTYNRNHTALECVIALDCNDAEIIVVDDGSPEPVIMPENIRVLRHDRNRGRAAALNTGLKAASHDLVLTIDDDVFASANMAARMVEEYLLSRNPKLALTGRVVWDPDVTLTATMRWLEQCGPLRDISSTESGPLTSLSTRNTLMWRPFVLEHGGFDETFMNDGLEDLELGFRLKQHALETRLLAPAVGYHHRTVKVRDLANHQFQQGISAVYLHSKFPDEMPQVDDVKVLLRNDALAPQAQTLVAELEVLEQSENGNLPPGATDLFQAVYRHHFLRGILEGLREIGGAKVEERNSHTLPIYNEASHLQSIGELDEARRLFRLVLHRRDEQYWAGAEYHLGVIAERTGNPEAAHAHLTECLRLNPGHRKARQRLQERSSFEEIEPNVFKRIGRNDDGNILLILFGGIGDIINAFPVIAALRDKFPLCEITWLTSPEYVSLAKASFVDAVHEASPRGIIPWDWIESGNFTHVYCPEGTANQEEWQQSGLHLIDFMAQKCGVDLKLKRALLNPGPEALVEAQEFLNKHGLSRKAFLAASHCSISSRHWRHSNLMKLAHGADTPMIVFGRVADPEIPGTISCFGQSLRMVAALIGWSSFYIGPDSGISWMATTTDTPMGVFLDPLRRRKLNIGFRDVLQGEKDDIEEWDIHTSPDAVIAHIQQTGLCRA